MKRLILLSIFLTVIFSGLFAQNKAEYFKARPQSLTDDTPAWAQLMYADDPNVGEVDAAFQAYYTTHDFVKTLHTQNYKYWRRTVAPYLTTTGYIRPASPADQDAWAMRVQARKQATRDPQACWQALGPVETYQNGTLDPISWQVNVYSVDVYAGDPTQLLAGTEAGGVFHSTDQGLNWTLISAGEVFCNGITAVKIHPNNPQHFLISGNDRIYRSTDAGASWEAVYLTNGSIFEFKYDPANDQRLLAVGSNGLYESTDAGATWEQQMTNTCRDLDFHPANPDIVYLLRDNGPLKRTEFFRSADGGENWALQDNGWYSPENIDEANYHGGKIAISAAAPDRVYVALIGDSKADDNGWIGLYRSDDQGQNWSLPSGQIGGPYGDINTTIWNPAAYSDGYHQGFYNFDLEADPDNADRLWMGTIRLSESTDGGMTFRGIGAANSDRLSLIHADIQDLEVIGDDIWVASDGGLNYSNDDLQSHESRKRGIIGSEFWGFGMGWNEDVLVGGKYHNGNSAYYQTYGLGQYHHVGGVEEATGYVNPLQNRRVYFNRYWTNETMSMIIAEDLGGSTQAAPSVPYIPNEVGSGLFFDKRYADHIYTGVGSQVLKSVDGGSSFEVLYDFGQNGKVYEIEFAYTDPEVLYATFQPNGGYWDWYEIHKSTDGGQSWIKLTDVPTDRWRMYISINPLDKNELWVVARSGQADENIFQTTDGGESWINRSDNLLGDGNLRDVVVQGGSDIVYVASRTGVFYFDKNANTWSAYDTDLPTITNAFRLLPFYRDSKLRLATYGRGIWEVDFAQPSTIHAQAITASDTVYCSRDTVQFESYSIADHTDLSWNWDITPTPLWLEDATMRNPRMVLGENGSYDVRLTLTHPDGSSEYYQPAMVTVASVCEADTIPDRAVALSADGDYVQLPDMELDGTQSFSVTAWVKTNALQPSYSGILMNDGVAAGLNFLNNDNENNTLGYHWPGGAWWWNSGLQVPVGEWVYVALVAEPSGITVYMNGRGAKHETAIQPVDLQSMKIGSYQGWGGRNLNAEIEEVCIWDRALTEQEIRSYRHLTKEDLQGSTEAPLAYYQFNGPQSRILDRMGTRHATLSGQAEKVVSSAPIGGGAVAQGYMDGAVENFPSVGMTLLGQGQVGNQGEVYITRINQQPFAAPEDREGTNCYWIINDYSETGLVLTSGGLRLTSPYAQPSEEAQQMPEIVELRQRIVPGFEDNWLAIAGLSAINTTETSYGFEIVDEAALAGQYVIWRDEVVNSHDIPAENTLQLFPNPTSEVIFVPVAGKKMLYDEAGKFLRSFSENEHTVVDLPAGLYTIRMGDRVVSFVKE